MRESDEDEVSVLDLWLISGSRVRRGEQGSLPSFSPMARGTFDVVAHGMLLFIPLGNKSHMFLFFETRSLLLWTTEERGEICNACDEGLER